MTTGAMTLERPVHVRSLVAGFTAFGVAVGLLVGTLVTREVLNGRSVPATGAAVAAVTAANPSAAIREQGATLPAIPKATANASAAVREQGAGVPSLGSLYGPGAAAIREQGATLPWTAAATRAGFTGRLGGATGERPDGPVVVHGEPCHQCA